MKFSWDWIQDHIKLDMSVAEAADLLSLRGLTVDELIENGDDVVLDIDITTNRPDAMNVRGIARELSAITGVGLESVPVNFHEQTRHAHEFASIDIENPDLCHRFGARVIKNAKNGQSPEWMRRRLEAVGMRSLNLLIDITNYVLWELGHPLHGYDLNRIAGSKLIARLANDGEKVKLIDGETRKLSSDMLVIADKDGAVGIAGVMGGEDTEIGNTTRDILLECAWFDPVVTRSTARALGLNTEASYRFERGMDHDDIPQAIDRCCHLYYKLADAEICRDMIDEYPTVPPARVVTMNHEKLCSFAGMPINKDRVAQVFSALDLAATFRENIWKVEVPSRRVDISRAADLYEEVIRIIGYDAIPSTLPHVRQQVLGEDDLHQSIEEVTTSMLGMGYDEVMNYDFIDPDHNALFAPACAGEPIMVTNPIATPHMTTMRQSLAPSLVMNLQHNINRGQSGVRLFEIARVFFDKPTGPRERTMLCVAADAAEPEPHWHSSAGSVDFFELKGVIEYLFTRLGLSGIVYDTGGEEFLRPGMRAAILLQQDGSTHELGWIGCLSRPVQEHFDLPDPVFMAQLDLEKATELRDRDSTFQRPSAYPSVSRDISFVLPSGEGITFETIRKTITEAGVSALRDIRLIDRYSGEETSGETSMAIRLTYQRHDKTLVQEEVDEFHAGITDKLAALGLRIR